MRISEYMEGLLKKNHSSEIISMTSKEKIAFLEGNPKGLKDVENFPIVENMGNTEAIEDDEKECY